MIMTMMMMRIAIMMMLAMKMYNLIVMVTFLMQKMRSLLLPCV